MKRYAFRCCIDFDSTDPKATCPKCGKPAKRNWRSVRVNYHPSKGR